MPYLCSPKVTKNMAQQDIRYGGYATTPNDRDCPDGPLATSINLINEDGALQPLIEPEDLFTLPAGYKLWCIHATAVFKHYIVETDEHELAWIDVNNTSHIEPIDNYSATTIHQVTTVGNTLCVLDNNGLNYILWQADINRYTYLGQKPPMLELSFGLSETKMAKYPMNEGENPNMDEYNSSWMEYGTIGEIFNDRNNVTHQKYFKNDAEIRKGITEAIWGLVNKTRAVIQKDGHFYAPFFVRYCYRMYDGTMWMHSAPVFMPVSMANDNFVTVVNAHTFHDNLDRIAIYNSSMTNMVNVTPPPNGGTSFIHLYNKVLFRYEPNNVALTFKIQNATSLYELKDRWNDIIKSVDIFVSLPLIREDNSEVIKSISAKTSPYILRGGNLTSFSTWQWSDSVFSYVQNVGCDIPLISEENYLDKIHSVDNFYKVASYDLEDDTLLTSDYDEVKIDKTVLPVLATQERMTDDYKSHNTLLPLTDDSGNCVTSLYNNNKRLYVAAPKDKLFEGFNISTLVPYCTSSIQYNVSDIIVKLNTEEGTKTVHINSWNDYRFHLSANSSMIICCPLFYPDSRAVEMRVVTVLNNVHFRTFILPMKSLPMLNGAMTKGGLFINGSATFTTEGSLPVVNDTINYSTKLYISDVNNPFIFPSTGINSVGSGRITGIATVNEPVSTGQFGYSDIYIFTTDGLWVAKIGSDGGLTSIQPVKADVCISPESITQLSGSVLFATARGIMEVVGNQTVCISDILNGYLRVSPHTLPHAEELHQLLGHSDTSCLNPAPFLEYVQGCRMIYDYTHQRIVVFNPTIEDGERKYTYAYVYSLKSKLWGMMYNNLSYGFNSYPDAMAVDDSNNVVTLSGSETVFEKQMLITRPMKLGATDTLKTIRDLIQRGVFNRGDVNTVLYGSRDLINWHLIGSSTYHYLRNLRGTGYKYFRIASVTSLAKGESMSGVTLEAVPKHTNLLI